MKELRCFLMTIIDENLNQITISGPKNEGGISKAKVRPVLIKDAIMYQVTQTIGTKEIHKNLEKDQLIPYLCELMADQFKQMQLDSTGVRATVLVSKKGKVTINRKKTQSERDGIRELTHNRKKNYILQEGIPVPFLVSLGVMNEEGKVLSLKYDKFKQLNRFLEFIEDILPILPRGREITILDFGCGKSYLTFAMYYFFNELCGLDVTIVGLDLKEDVIHECNLLACKFGYTKLRFLQGDIASYEGVEQVDMVVSLHACDTATDYALEKAVSWNASVILSVPCCQHELNKQISSELLSPIFSYGILKERFAALLTDGLRAKLLESKGYDTQILEFIDMEHTPKNLLIRAVKRGTTEGSKREYQPCMSFFNVSPTLDRLFYPQEDAADETNIG